MHSGTRPISTLGSALPSPAEPSNRLHLAFARAVLAALATLFLPAASSPAQQTPPATQPSATLAAATQAPQPPALKPWSALIFPDSIFEPMHLSVLPDEGDVYAPPAPPREEEGINSGGVNFDILVNYTTAHVYRGVNYSNIGGGRNRSLNLQVDAKVSFDLGKFPHPFAGVFSNIDDSDTVSRFQEIRPYAGLEWKVRPLTFAGGINSYIYPEREKTANTSEVWGKVTLDDSYLLGTDQPLLSPYFYGAYDYDRNQGWYFEAGVRHDFIIGDSGLTLSAVGDVAFISGIQQMFVFVNRHDQGFQHYDAGLIVNYSLNNLFAFSRRYGDWSLNGYMYYTGKLQHDLLAQNVLWGGIGIEFKY